jgi:hypothetical protein
VPVAAGEVSSITMRTLSAMLAVAALLMAGAAPASAVTGGFGVSKALRGAPLPISFARASGKSKHTFCEATGARASKLQHSKTMATLEKQFAPVACEQPPRSQLLTPDALKQAATAALAVLG